MIKVNVMYLLILITWYFLFLIFFLFLYFKYSKPYYVKIDKRVNKIPENLNPNELSMLLHHKITPSALTATIIYLINEGIIIREKNILKRNCEDKVLSVSQNSALDLLFDTLGNGKKLDIDKISNFCNSNTKCTDFLIAYDIWKNMATREAVSSKQFFVQKMDYELVKWFQYIGYFLVILNFILGLNFISGYLAIIPAYFLLQYFYKIYKRTPHYQEQFYKWLSFRDSLNNIKSIEEIKINKKWCLIYSSLLDKLSHIENVINQEQFLTKLDKDLQYCYRKAYFFGNRKI